MNGVGAIKFPPHTGQHLQGCVACYAYVEGKRAEFDALLVGPSTSGGIRHRGRRLPRQNVSLYRSRRWNIHLRPGFRLGVAVVPHYVYDGDRPKYRDGFDVYVWAWRLIIGFHWPQLEAPRCG